jgi:hypothetical protein
MIPVAKLFHDAEHALVRLQPRTGNPLVVGVLAHRSDGEAPAR